MFEKIIDEIKSEKNNKNGGLNNLSNYIIDEKDFINIFNEKNEENIMNDNEFYKKIKKVNSFIKILEKSNLVQYINIPRICAVGTQSSGKTSILTNIIGLDILPKGNGVVTRRPIELRLNKIKSDEPYIYFDNDINNKITNFSTIKDKII